MSKEPNNGRQKGARRQRLHKHQNNHGTKENPTQYESFDGTPAE